MAELPLRNHEEVHHKVPEDDESSDNPKVTNAADSQTQAASRTTVWYLRMLRVIYWRKIYQSSDSNGEMSMSRAI
jgi:hypothetical protein